MEMEMSWPFSTVQDSADLTTLLQNHFQSGSVSLSYTIMCFTCCFRHTVAKISGAKLSRAWESFFLYLHRILEHFYTKETIWTLTKINNGLTKVHVFYLWEVAKNLLHSDHSNYKTWLLHFHYKNYGTFFWRRLKLNIWLLVNCRVASCTKEKYRADYVINTNIFI